MARQWNEVLLGAIRRDFARPPVQARNLYHISAAMYEAWAAYDADAEPFLLGRTRAGYTCPFDGLPVPQDIEAARQEAISYAAYRLMAQRYQNSPGYFLTMLELNGLMDSLGYDVNNISQDYITKGPAELGNYIAAQILAYGLQDGSYEQLNFANQYYSPVNIPMVVADPGNPNMTDPNRWQQLTLALAIDQQGNPIPSTPPFQSPEWGNVDPFAMDTSDMVEYQRDGHVYKVWHDPDDPPYLDTTTADGLSSFYKWNFCMVPIWQSHLDPADSVLIDISPASRGNIQTYPGTEQEIRDFYDYFNGGDPGEGYAVNPATGLPYAPQVVNRGDYTRILAEFWADGPNSETPPGHWFAIMHTVMDHPLFERRWMGQGDILGPLEYDVKAHLALGGAMHDAAITAWGIKGWYDYVRPVSAVRYMAEKGQCSDPLAPNYHPAGIPLVPGYIELVQTGDALAGVGDEHVGKVKLFTWRGPSYINDPELDVAGVGWILAENWFPYQRPTFVTPPFAGYVSGHSTFSRSAAEVLTLITGDPYFPGGMSGFVAPQNDFLVFEQGPTQDIILQWATYRDASDQCSLSRIWGGIHPPIDDIPGRHLGMIIGPDAVDEANSLFDGNRPHVISVNSSQPVLNAADIGGQFQVSIQYDAPMDTTIAPSIQWMVEDPLAQALELVSGTWISNTTYTLTLELEDVQLTMRDIHMRIDSAFTADGIMQNVHLSVRPFTLDTERPSVIDIANSTSMINDALAASGDLQIVIEFDEDCDTNTQPAIVFTPASLNSTFILEPTASMWLEPDRYKAVFQITDNNEEIPLFGFQVSTALDVAGNDLLIFDAPDQLSLDTRAPQATAISMNTSLLNDLSVGQQALSMQIEFDEAMDLDQLPTLQFINGDPIGTSLLLNASESGWTDPAHFTAVYALFDAEEEFQDLLMDVTGATDNAGNPVVMNAVVPALTIDTKAPLATSATPSANVIADALLGDNTFTISIQFTEEMDQQQTPQITLIASSDVSSSVIHEPAMDAWIGDDLFTASYTIMDQNVEVSSIGMEVIGAYDAAGNAQLMDQFNTVFSLDTRNPQSILNSSNTYLISDDHIGSGGVQIVSVFDEPMDATVAPQITFSPEVDDVLTLNEASSMWLNAFTYRTVFDVLPVVADLPEMAVSFSIARDVAGNPIVPITENGWMSLSIVMLGMEGVDAMPPGIHPNPLSSGQTLWIDHDHSLNAPSAALLDMHGKQIMVYGPLRNGSPASIQIPVLPNGAYMLMLSDENYRAYARVMVVN